MVFGSIFNIDHPDVIVRENKQNIGWVSHFFIKDNLIRFLTDNNITIEYGNTQYNCVLVNQVVKIHGDPKETITIG